MTEEQIEKLIRGWSMEFGVAMSTDALNALVSALYLGIGVK